MVGRPIRTARGGCFEMLGWIGDGLLLALVIGFLVRFTQQGGWEPLLGILAFASIFIIPLIIILVIIQKARARKWERMSR